MRLDADGGAGLRLPAQAGAGLRRGGVENFSEWFLGDALELFLAVVVDGNLRGGDEAGLGIGRQGIDDDVTDGWRGGGERAPAGGDRGKRPGLGSSDGGPKGA